LFFHKWYGPTKWAIICGVGTFDAIATLTKWLYVTDVVITSFAQCYNMVCMQMTFFPATQTYPIIILIDVVKLLCGKLSWG